MTFLIADIWTESATQRALANWVDGCPQDRTREKVHRTLEHSRRRGTPSTLPHRHLSLSLSVESVRSATPTRDRTNTSRSRSVGFSSDGFFRVTRSSLVDDFAISRAAHCESAFSDAERSRKVDTASRQVARFRASYHVWFHGFGVPMFLSFSISADLLEGSSRDWITRRQIV